MERREVVFVDGVRTAFGRAGPQGIFWRKRLVCVRKEKSGRAVSVRGGVKRSLRDAPGSPKNYSLFSALLHPSPFDALQRPGRLGADGGVGVLRGDLVQDVEHLSRQRPRGDFSVHRA